MTREVGLDRIAASATEEEPREVFWSEPGFHENHCALSMYSPPLFVLVRGHSNECCGGTWGRNILMFCSVGTNASCCSERVEDDYSYVEF